MRKMKVAEIIYKAVTGKQTPSEVFEKMDSAAKSILNRDAHLSSIPRS